MNPEISISNSAVYITGNAGRFYSPILFVKICINYSFATLNGYREIIKI